MTSKIPEAATASHSITSQTASLFGFETAADMFASATLVVTATGFVMAVLAIFISLIAVGVSIYLWLVGKKTTRLNKEVKNEIEKIKFNRKASAELEIGQKKLFFTYVDGLMDDLVINTSTLGGTGFSTKDPLKIYLSHQSAVNKLKLEVLGLESDNVRQVKGNLKKVSTYNYTPRVAAAVKDYLKDLNKLGMFGRECFSAEEKKILRDSYEESLKRLGDNNY